MGRWELISVQVMNQFEDEVVWAVHYGKRTIRNHYRFKTGLTMMDDYRDRKIGESRTLDGGKWIEGTIKGRGRKPAKKTPPTPYQLYLKKVSTKGERATRDRNGRPLSFEGFLLKEKEMERITAITSMREHRDEYPNCELVGCCNEWPKEWF